MKLLILPFLLAAGMAQTPTPVAPKPKPVQVMVPKKVDDSAVKTALLVEENIQLKAQIVQNQSQQALSPLNEQYQVQEKIINDWVEQVKKDNGWDSEVVYNRQKNQFEIPLKTAEASKTASEPEKDVK